MKTIIAISLASFTMFFSVIAHTHYKDHQHSTLQTIILDQTEARETPPGVKVGAGYLNITNIGKENDTLLSISGDIAPIIQIHTMTVENETFRMEQLKEGLEIPAGKTIKLEAGGKHLMFMNLSKALKEGEQYKVTLNFEKAGAIETIFNVKKHQNQSTHGNHGKHHKDNAKQDTEKHKHH